MPKAKHEVEETEIKKKKKNNVFTAVHHLSRRLSILLDVLWQQRHEIHAQFKCFSQLGTINDDNHDQMKASILQESACYSLPVITQLW